MHSVNIFSLMNRAAKSPEDCDRRACRSGIAAPRARSEFTVIFIRANSEEGARERGEREGSSTCALFFSVTRENNDPRRVPAGVKNLPRDSLHRERDSFYRGTFLTGAIFGDVQMSRGDL